MEERHRAALLRAAARSWGEEAADTLSELLPTSGNRPATRRDVDAAVDRITAVVERRVAEALTAQTRTLVFSQVTALVAIAALAFGLG